jgi:uncharacterized pyridoxal phosphate-containing UPF0001 family protein
MQVIHSLDAESQVDAIDRTGSPVEAFLQLNLHEEQQKSGIPAKMLDKLVSYTAKSQNVRLTGLMTIGSASANLEERRLLFRHLRELAHGCGLANLSMGMSGDWEIALHEGATHIRIGTAIFGER